MTEPTQGANLTRKFEQSLESYNQAYREFLEAQDFAFSTIPSSASNERQRTIANTYQNLQKQKAALQTVTTEAKKLWEISNGRSISEPVKTSIQTSLINGLNAANELLKTPNDKTKHQTLQKSLAPLNTLPIVKNTQNIKAWFGLCLSVVFGMVSTAAFPLALTVATNPILAGLTLALGLLTFTFAMQGIIKFSNQLFPNKSLKAEIKEAKDQLSMLSNRLENISKTIDTLGELCEPTSDVTEQEDLHQQSTTAFTPAAANQQRFHRTHSHSSFFAAASTQTRTEQESQSPKQEESPSPSLMGVK